MIRRFAVQVTIGGGNTALPDDLRADLTLLDARRFASGFVLLSYRVESST